MAKEHLDLIDRQALLAKKTEMELCFAVSEYDIANAPKVDAVEVVRCKDCVYRKRRVCAMPYAGMWVGVELKDSDFCSYGERRTDG